MQKKVLVVEDDSELVELLSFNLKKAGFAVGTAADGIEALKKARSLLPDLILLDLMLPELDGFAVCEILREAPQTATVPIIMLTAISGQMARLIGLEAGASEYISKPFSPKNVVMRVEGWLAKNRGGCLKMSYTGFAKENSTMAKAPMTPLSRFCGKSRPVY
jgi:DNA-binding response OmpR family regulator